MRRISDFLMHCRRSFTFAKNRIFGKSRRTNYDSALTAEGLVSHVNKCLLLPTVYMWDGKGETVTKTFIKKMRILYPKYYTEQRINHLLEFVNKDVRGFDCSGLIKNYVMGGLEHYEYDASKDLNSLALFEKSTNKGPIETMPEKPGICLYMPGHTAVYVGNGLVIESTDNPDFGDGVISTKVSDRPWEQWYEMPWVEYD